MNKEKSIKILNELVNHLGITVNQLSESIGKGRSQWAYDVLNPKKKVGISKNIAELISNKYPEINRAWLLGVDDNMLLAGDTTQPEAGDSVVASEDVPAKSYTRGKPYYNVDFIGGFDLVLNDQTINPDYLIDFKKYEEADYWCNITGHSMEPLISNGDIIALKQLNGWRDFLLYGEVYGVVTDEMRTVKIVTKSEKGDDYLQLVPVNKSPEYQPQDIPVRLITHVLQVLGCMKKL